jgi:NitT/TauT family transport system substrate-binding protein
MADWRRGYSEFNDKNKDQKSTGMKSIRGGSMTGLSTLLRSSSFAATALAIAALAAPAPAAAQAPSKITIVVFGFPSLGAFMPPVIKAKKLDEAHGLDIEFVERPPDAYTTQFNSGEFKVGGSAAVLTVGLADARGVKVKYLFNLFDFWGTIVTSRSEIKSVKDLEDKQLAAASSTTNFIMSEFFAKQQGVDISKVQVVNTATPGLVGYALADRADAIQLWEPAYTLLKSKKPDIRMLETNLSKTWKSFAGGGRIPYLGLAAHDDWIEANQALIPKLYATYKEAGDYIVKHPEESAALISPKATPADLEALVSLIKSNERLGMSVVGANEVREQIEAVYKAGIDVGYLKTRPSNDTIYAKPLK